MKRLGILGASGHGKVIADAALLSGWDDVFFYDDAWPKLTQNGRWPVVGNSLQLLDNKEKLTDAIVAIGNNQVRFDKSKKLIEAGLNLVSVIHPSAIISQTATLGMGCFISAGVVIQVDAKISNFSIINTNAIVEHDCVIGAAVHICPSVSLAGGVVVGDLSWIGIGSAVKQLIQIGSNVMIGAGAVVVKNIPSNVTAIGNPAKFQ